MRSKCKQTQQKFSKLVLAHGQKRDTNFQTYRLKKNRSYKVVLRGMHSQIDINEVTDALKKFNHKLRQLNIITKYDTKQPLHLLFIEHDPNEDYLTRYYPSKLQKLKTLFLNFYAVKRMNTLEFIVTECLHASIMPANI